ncbi:TRAP transporter permease [Thermodesulfobacteriota bacterium]
MAQNKPPLEADDVSPQRYRQLRGIHRWIALFFPLIAILGSIYYLFHFRPFDIVFVDQGYLYYLISFLLPLVYIYLPAYRKASYDRVPWYDNLIASIAFAIPFYLFLNAFEIGWKAWEVAPPTHVVPLSLIFIIVVIEGIRRAAGLVVAMLCTFFSIYPLFAMHMPLPLTGLNLPWNRIVSFHAMGPEGIIGVPMRVLGSIVIGFLVFAVALQIVGGSKFFLNLALAALGNVRGGAAKVSIFASALFGSISGSVVANVLTTGAFTIPAMKKSGYPPRYAAGIEACASTGGVLMPPIMGATAFVMAEFLGMPYRHIIVTAFVPSVLYYLALFMQVDAVAAKAGLKGIPRESLPSIRQTLKDGWFIIVGMAVLLYVLLVAVREAQAPYIAAAVMIALAMISKKTRLRPGSVIKFLEGNGKVLCELLAINCGIGIIIGSLVLTGAAMGLSGGILRLAGGNLYLLIAFGFIASLILGMGLTITACYVLLALLLAPALIEGGINILAAHMFVMYCGMISFITPPVCVASFTAASLAGAQPMKVGYLAMRLGIAIYFIPFFFVLNPALILQGSPLETLQTISTCLLGVIFISGAMEGYILKLGKVNIFIRPLFFLGGVLLGFPNSLTDFMGIITIVLSICVVLVTKRFSLISKVEV